MSYKTKTELENYMLKDGDVPFWEKNWILSTIHNRPHNILSDNSDALKNRLDIISGKSGISYTQRKMDGFPIWTGTSYVLTGHTFVDALSVLDSEMKNLENEFREVLISLARREAEKWVIKTSSLSVPLVETDTVPAPIGLLDLDSFVTIIIPDQTESELFYCNKIEGNWVKYSKTVQEILGQNFSTEKLTSVLFNFVGDYKVRMVGTYYDSNQTYSNYVKSVAGIVDPTAEDPLLMEESNDSIVHYFTNIPEDLCVSGRPNKVDIENNRIIYFPCTPSISDIYSTDRNARLMPVSELRVIDYPKSEFKLDNRELGIYIEGVPDQIDYISSYDIKRTTNNEFAMVLVDGKGNMLFRKSIDGVNWYIPPNYSANACLLENSDTVNLDFPTMIPYNNGYLVFYNTDYEMGILDTLGYIYTEDGINWELPEEFFDIQGVFPKLLKRRNGDIYLLYFDSGGISTRKLYIHTGRTFTVSG